MSSSNEAAAGILVSRVFGLLREVLIGALLPLQAPAATAFRLAMRLPNVIQNLLGEGSLSASFVPVYAKLIEDKQEAEARRVAGAILGVLSLVIAIIVTILMIGASVIVKIMGPGLEKETQDLAAMLLRITAPGIGLLGISAWCLGILNSHRQYFLAYVAPTLWNGAQIVALLLAALLVQLGDGPSEKTIVTWLAVAVLLGSALQLGVQVPRVRFLTQGVTPHLRREGKTRVVLRRFGPAVGARGIVQISSLVDLFLAGYLVSGAIPIIALVTPLYILPISLFGFSVATTELTEMSRQSDRADIVARRVRIGLRKVALAAGLCTPILVFGGRSIIGTLYQWPSNLFGRDAISADGAIVIGLTLGVYALGLPASMSARISQNALFSLGDVTTPARIAVVRLGVLTSVSVLVMFQADRLSVIDGVIHGWDQLPHWQFWQPVEEAIRHSNDTSPHLGPVGVAVGAMTASWTEWVLLRMRLRRKLHTSVNSGLLFPIFAAGAGTGAVVLAIRAYFPFDEPFEGIAVGAGGLATFVVLLWFQGLRPRGSGSSPGRSGMRPKKVSSSKKPSVRRQR